jgi:hypothetical protein
MALFTLPQMIQRLTKGFVKVTGRMPDGLEKIKIKQEALERIKQQDKVVDMEGNVIDTSKGIMGGKQVGMFDNIFNRMQKDMGRGDPKIVKSKNKTMIDEAIDNASPGFAGDIKYDAELVAEDLAERMGKVYDDLPTKERLDLYDQAYTGLSKQRFKGMKKPKDDPEEKAMGGRIGLKAGMSRRAFLKLMGGVGAGIGALKTGILKLAGKEGARQVTKNIIKTDALPNKPEWFDALVTKVINEGEDITKKFATGERQTVHKLDVDSFTDSKGNKVITEEVRVTQDPDTGEIRVEYVTPDSPGESQVDLVYKKPKPDESDPNPSAEFYAVESEPRVVNYDGDIEFDGENLVNNVDELMTDTTKLKIIAKGDNKPTLKEFVQSKKKKDQVERLNTNTMNQVDYIETKYGPGPDPSDYVDDMASGGLAGMLGE